MAVTTPRPPLAGGRRDPSRRDVTAPWRHVDLVLVIAVLSVASMGVLMVFSATRGPTEPYDTSYVVRQGMFLVIGTVLMAVTALVDYRRLKDVAPVLYLGMIGLLVLVVSPLGASSKGAQAWFALGPFQLQPSEFSKIALIVTLSTMLANFRGDIGLARLALLGGMAGLPMALIMLQPDLGTVLVFVVITASLFLIGGVRVRYLALLAFVALIGVVGVLRSDVLADYQRDRLTNFLDPTADTRGSSYNVNQSQVAIAEGGITGEGLFQGRQTQLQYVPEQETDFIFTVVGEELGFIGGATLLALYGVIVWRIWRTAQLASDSFGQLMCVGILAMLVFQLFESVGMTMGIMPVTGIPLPFLSYGGSNMLTSFVAIGIVQNVHMRRFR